MKTNNFNLGINIHTKENAYGAKIEIGPQQIHV